MKVGKIVSFALSIYIVAYIVFDAILASANKTGFNLSRGGILDNLALTVMPILLMIGAVWIMYKETDLE